MKRTAMVRKTPMARTPKPAKGPRPKKCANRACRAQYVPDTKQPWKNWCSDDCALVIALDKLAKQKAAKAKKERAEDQVKREGMKKKGEFVKDAQRAFNAWVRKRDQLAGHLCISSGKPLDWSGNNVDAGHYRSRGSAPHLRFDERNCHAQSKQENRYGSGNATDYRIGLIARIGLEAVQELEADNDPRHHSIDDLRAITVKYRAKLRELQKQQT